MNKKLDALLDTLEDVKNPKENVSVIHSAFEDNPRIVAFVEVDKSRYKKMRKENQNKVIAGRTYKEVLDRFNMKIKDLRKISKNSKISYFFIILLRYDLHGLLIRLVNFEYKIMILFSLYIFVLSTIVIKP